MNKELEKILVEKYPIILKDYYGDVRHTCLAFGFEHEDGWYKIMDHLLGYLTQLMERELTIQYKKEYRDQYTDVDGFCTKYYYYRTLPPQITINQIKEKYGTLRVYYQTEPIDVPEDIWVNLDQIDFDKKINNYEMAIHNAIDFATYQSSITCEITGKDGKYYDQGWCMVRCDEEAIKAGKNPENGRNLKWKNL